MRRPLTYGVYTRLHFAKSVYSGPRATTTVVRTAIQARFGSLRASGVCRGTQLLSTSIWDQVLGRIEAKVGRHSFHTWFKPTSLLSDEGDLVTVRVPNPLFTEWLPKHYSVVLAEALKDVGRADVELVFVPEGTAHPAGIAPALESTMMAPAPPAPLPDQRPVARASPRRRDSTLATRSTRSSSDPRTSLRTPRVARLPKRRRARTTRCSSTAVSDSARRT